MLRFFRLSSQVLVESYRCIFKISFLDKSKSCFLMLSYAAVSGCSTISGTPKPAIDTDVTIQKYSEALMKLADEPPKGCDKVKDGVNQALTVMDLRYAQFIDDISIENKTKTTATDFLLLGLGLAGTAVGGAEAKTVFTALSAGIAGMNTSIDKNFYYEKTMPALVSKMNADRKQKQLSIIERLKACAENKADYTWFEAVHDLTEYYAAGTVLGAISSISKDAGKSQVLSEEQIQKLNSASPFRLGNITPTTEWLDQVLDIPDGQVKIMSCWKEVSPRLFQPNNGSKCSPDGNPNAARLIRSEECVEEQSKIRACLEKRGVEPE